MKITTCSTTLATLLLLVGLAPATLAGSSEGSPSAGSSTADGRGPVYVDSTDILYLESFPVQVQLAVTGSLPTPCDRLAWDVQQDSDGIAVSLWSESDADAFCASVLAPFEVSIPLGAFETADLALTLNGDDIGRVQIGVVSPPPAGDASLDAAGWSFGMCVGLCNADLGIDGSALLLVGTDRTRNVTLFRNAGSLTAAGQEAIAHALEVLGHTPLQGVYGCPDCADGGAFYLVVQRDGVPTRSTMEFGTPPDELAELNDIASSAIDALISCTSNDLVQVDEGCQAQPR